jgi:AraC-like DNA-binding protein
MPRPPVTISIAFVHGMLSGAKARGLACEAFVADAGIAPELLEQAGARVSVAQYIALFRLLMTRLDDELIGFLSRPLKHGSFALIARSAISATTLETAMRRAAHVFHLLQDDVKLEARREGVWVGWSMRFADAAVAQPLFLHELLLRGLWRTLAWLVGGQLQPERFDFAFPSPPYAAGYARIFPAPLRFDCAQSAFWFDAARLGDPVRREEAALRAFLADAQTQLIVPPRGGEVGARVRSHLLRTELGWPDLAATADALHMSIATLQRRLAAEGTSFQSLKDELRRDLAIVRMNTSAVPLATLAAELGFADSAAFQRAFKAWTGSAPGLYRRGGG